MPNASGQRVLTMMFLYESGPSQRGVHVPSEIFLNITGILVLAKGEDGFMVQGS